MKDKRIVLVLLVMIVGMISILGLLELRGSLDLLSKEDIIACPKYEIKSDNPPAIEVDGNLEISKGENSILTITAKSSNGISKIIYPDGTEENCNGELNYSGKYVVIESGDYKFKVIDTNGEVSDTIAIVTDKEDYTS